MGGQQGLKQTAFAFRPFSRKQKQLLTWWLPESGVSDADGIIADGAIRTGKTVCMSLAFVQWAMASFQGQNFAVCGKTVGSFRRNVLSVLKQTIAARGYLLADKRSENLLVISRGDVTNYFYIFGGKDESSQDLIQGITLAGVLLDEVALMPRSFVDQALARCSVAGSKFWFNCNPQSPMHWFKRDFVDHAKARNLLYLSFRMEDNLSLSEAIKNRYRSMYSGVFYQRYILGEWVLAEGLVYDFGEACITDETPEGAEYYISCDYGTLNPFSAGLWSVTGGKAVRIREYYHDGRSSKRQLTDEDYCDAVAELAGGLRIDKVIVDPSAASFLTALRRRGHRVQQADNSVLDGIRLTAVCLRGGNIKIHRSCTDAIREFGLYRWDDKATTDKVIKEHDHAMDDIRYFCTTVMRRRIKGLINERI